MSNLFAVHLHVTQVNDRKRSTRQFSNVTMRLPRISHKMVDSTIEDSDILSTQVARSNKRIRMSKSGSHCMSRQPLCEY